MHNNDVPAMNLAMDVETIFGLVQVPLMILSAREGGAPLVACLQLWQHAWRADFPGKIAATMALLILLRETADAKARAEMN